MVGILFETSKFAARRNWGLEDYDLRSEDAARRQGNTQIVMYSKTSLTFSPTTVFELEKACELRLSFMKCIWTLKKYKCVFHLNAHNSRLASTRVLLKTRDQIADGIRKFPLEEKRSSRAFTNYHIIIYAKIV